MKFSFFIAGQNHTGLPSVSDLTLILKSLGDDVNAICWTIYSNAYNAAKTPTQRAFYASGATEAECTDFESRDKNSSLVALLKQAGTDLALFYQKREKEQAASMAGTATPFAGAGARARAGAIVTVGPADYSDAAWEWGASLP